MPAQKTKSSTAINGAAKPRGPSASGTSTPVALIDKKEAFEPSTTTAKPDKAVYDAEQLEIKDGIDILQLKLSAVREKITFGSNSGPSNDRKNALRAELDALREQQSGNKNSRGKLFDQVAAINEGIQKKIQEILAAKTKLTFKTVAEVDAHIQYLNRQIESGNLKLGDEKRALQEITTSKRNRRIVETLQADQEIIDADRRKIEELRAQYDNPESKALAARYDAIKAELDELKKEGDEAYAGRSKLYEERDNIQADLKLLYNKKRDSTQAFREASDRYWNKVNEDRARRAEKLREQRAAEEAQKKKELAERLREEAHEPAFQADIEDCQTLIDFLSGKTTGNVTYKSSSLQEKIAVPGVATHDIRKVEGPTGELVARKKKGEKEQDYFIAKKGGKKDKKGAAKPSNGSIEPMPSSPAPSSSGPLNIALPTLSALLALSIPPPASAADVPRVIEDLKTKKSWFEANQARVTADNVAKAEKNIQRLTQAVKELKADDAIVANGNDEYPTVSNSTSANPIATTVPIPSEVEENLVQGNAA